MITDKELESLMRKVDGAVDRQYDFIREMKGIKNYLWELKATMQESPVEETITPPIVETTVAPVVPEVVDEEKLTPMVVEEKVTEEVAAEETTITPQPPVEEKQAYQSKKPDFEKQVDDWFKPKEAINWERFIGENLFSKIGIGIIIIGVFIGVKYSIEHNLISPAMRLVLSYLVGAGLFVAGAMLKKKYESFSAVLVSGRFSTSLLL